MHIKYNKDFLDFMRRAHSKVCYAVDLWLLFGLTFALTLAKFSNFNGQPKPLHCFVCSYLWWTFVIIRLNAFSIHEKKCDKITSHFKPFQNFRQIKHFIAFGVLHFGFFFWILNYRFSLFDAMHKINKTDRNYSCLWVSMSIQKVRRIRIYIKHTSSTHFTCVKSYAI